MNIIKGNKGIIYLIQPKELIGTNRYKIGCSKNTDLIRCKNGYKYGSRYLCIMECDEPYVIENTIKKTFNILFNLIAGNEYFEGNEKIMKRKFVELVLKHEDNYDDININNKQILFDTINPIESKNNIQTKTQNDPIITNNREDEIKIKNDEVNILVGINDITENRFKYLMEKQKQGNLEEIDKLQIKKYLIKTSLGLDTFKNLKQNKNVPYDYERHILTYYDSTFIVNEFEHLIDKTNINDKQNIELIKKVDVINDLINKLGFKLFHNYEYEREDFEEKIQEVMKTNELFTNPKLAKILFNSSKVSINSTKDFLGFVNSVLSNYKLKIHSEEFRVKKKDKKDKKNKDRKYSLGFVKDYDSIPHFIQHKINKGYKLNDSNNLMQHFRDNLSNGLHYDFLILSEEDKIKYDEELEIKEVNINVAINHYMKHLEAVKKYQKNNPDKMSEKAKKCYANKKLTNPEAYKKMLEHKKEQYKLKKFKNIN